MDEELKIAVKVNGGFGTVLIRANYLFCLYQYLDCSETIKIYAFGHKSAEINDAIFEGQPSIFWYGSENEWRKIDKKSFDLVFVLDIYPKIDYYNRNKCAKSEKLIALIDRWIRFRKDKKQNEYFKNLRRSKPYEYTKLIIQKRTILNSADIDGILDIGTEYRMPVVIQKDEEQTLAGFGLAGMPFITVQRGINPKLGVTETPKMWPHVYYEELISLLKLNYPQYKIVQLGESPEHCKRLQGIDIDLLGKTTWDDLKILLKHAALHIDCECGMVHLRKALHAGPSVVIFGPTPVELFGYSGNINLTSNVCKHWCAELSDGWEYHCLQGSKIAPCMQELTPQYVFSAIAQYMEGDQSVLWNHDQKTFYDTVRETVIKKYGSRLDAQYLDDWFSKEKILGFEITEIPVSQLKAHIFTGHKWEWYDIVDTPAYHYLTGEKSLYIENMQIREQNLEDNIHSVERYTALIESLEKAPSSNLLIVVDAENMIKDGQHRAAWWAYKYGLDASIPALRIYRH